MKKNTLNIISVLFAKRSFLLFFLAVTSFNVYAQKTKRIEILNANSIEYDERIGKDIKRLLGNVQFKHENAIMFCDSAYLNSETNYLQAFNHVHIIQADSIHLYGDFMNYNGQTKIAKVRRNVRLLHANAILTTDSLDFDRKINVAHYFNWGYIKDQENNLKSVNGYYYTDFKDYYAVDQVELKNPQYTIYSDSLRYNTFTDISYFYGPTRIVSDSNLIYCEFGWYDTKKNTSEIFKNAFVESKEKKLSGDSIYYDRNLHYGRGIGHVNVLDTAAMVLITGGRADYYENLDSAFVTINAIFTKFDQGDSLFLHADTLKMYRVIDTIQKPELVYIDSLLEDENGETYTQQIVSDTVYHQAVDTNKITMAFRHAQIFKADLQARSDSITYATQDSTIRLFGNPVIWSKENQMSASYIEILTERNRPKTMHLKQTAFIILQDDSVHFNQIEGLDMNAYFDSMSELERLHVIKNAKSVFFPREDASPEQQRDSIKGDLIGANITSSQSMMIWFKNNQPIKVRLYQNPEGELSPLELKKPEQLQLRGFNWLNYLRPKSKSDILIWQDITTQAPTFELKP